MKCTEDVKFTEDLKCTDDIKFTKDLKCTDDIKFTDDLKCTEDEDAKFTEDVKFTVEAEGALANAQRRPSKPTLVQHFFTKKASLICVVFSTQVKSLVRRRPCGLACGLCWVVSAARAEDPIKALAYVAGRDLNLS